MLYIGLDDKEYKLNTSKFLKPKSNCSKLHKQIREFLKRVIPNHQIIEEPSIRGCSKGVLRLDFMILGLMLIVEADGIQHDKFTPFFHSKSEFLKAKQRDILKERFAELNGFRLIRFKVSESESDWSRKLNESN